MHSTINHFVLAVMLKEGSSNDYYAALHYELVRHFKIKLLTFTKIDHVKQQAKRLYSSDQDNYEIGGYKAIEDNEWTDCVIAQQTPFIAHYHSELEKVFFDHALIAQLGLGSVINWPVVVNNEVIGTVNLLAEEQAYLNCEFQVFEELTPWFSISFLLASNSKE